MKVPAGIVIRAVTAQSLPKSRGIAQADADLATTSDQACTSYMGLADDLDRLTPVSGAGQPSAFSLRCSSFLRGLISG
jgi:hypothetical protein